MAGFGSFDKFPFIKDVLKFNWENLPDTFLDTIITSGVMKNDSEIAAQIKNGSNTFSARYYKPLTATNEMQVYNGKNDIQFNRVDGGYYSWVVFGRQQGWEALQFTDDFTGSNQMQYILSELGKYRTKERQKLLLKMLEGLFKVTDDGNSGNDWKLHTTDIAASDSSVKPENEMNGATIYEAIAKACGDQSDGFRVAIMHSAVAAKLNVLKLLEFDKYTIPNAMNGDLKTATINGIKVIINDGVPIDNSTGANKYTTYLFGDGALGYAPAPVTEPIEFDRDPIKQGGMNRVILRFREAIVPYGFSWKGNAVPEQTDDPKSQSPDVGIPDTELTKESNYKIYVPHKTIKLARIISN